MSEQKKPWYMLSVTAADTEAFSEPLDEFDELDIEPHAWEIFRTWCGHQYMETELSAEYTAQMVRKAYTYASIFLRTCDQIEKEGRG